MRIDAITHRDRSSSRQLCLFISILAMLAETAGADGEQSSATSTVGKIYRDNVDAVVSVIAYDHSNQPISQGSGFIISSTGRVVTNQHVISDASSIAVKMHSGAIYLAAGVSVVDCSTDLAIVDLEVKGVQFKTVSLADQPEIEIGAPVIVIGTPLSLESSVSDGIISGIRDTSDQKIRYFQTTAPVSSGNSGGPLFDSFGKVIGVITFKFDGGENLNFAVSSHSIYEMLPNVPDNPFVTVDSYLSRDEYSCPRVAESHTKTVDPKGGSIAGTYSGVWQSNGGHSGFVIMTIAVEGRFVSGKLSMTGSPLGYTGDEYTGQVDEFADGVLTVTLRTNDRKMKATAVFSGDDLMGDYSFRYRLIGRDRGKWILQRR